MIVRVNFRQHKFVGSVYKEIKLVVCPIIGMHFEYENGWALATVSHVNIGADWIGIDQYYPEFTDEELVQLEKLGWQIRK